MADQTDQQLLQRIQRGDRQAYASVIERYQRQLYNFALRFLSQPEAAADCVQHTFIQFFLHADALHSEEPLSPWLFRVARNRALDELRRQRTIPFSQFGETDDGAIPFDFADEAHPLPEAIAELADLQQILADAIAALPIRYREVVALRYAAELSFAEIGAILHLPEATVKTQFHRAKPLLRAFLVRYGVTEAH